MTPTDTALWMGRIKGLPRGFDAWAYREAFKGVRYILLECGEKRVATCKHCGHQWETGLKVKVTARCPACRTQAMVRSAKRSTQLMRSRFVSVVQRIPGAVVVRAIRCALDFRETPAKLHYSELRRTVWPDNAKAPLKFAEGWDGKGWAYSPNSGDCYPNVVHPCCRAALKNTRWKYSGLPEAGACGDIPVDIYLRSYLRYPCIEMLAKQGFRNMMLDVVEMGRPRYNLEPRLRGTPETIVGLPHRYWPIVRELDLRAGTTDILGSLVNMGYQPTLEDARMVLTASGLWYGDRHWAPLLFRQFGKLIPYRPTMDYLAKQAAELRTDYRDYLNMAQRLRLDLTDPDVLRPTRLMEAHDRLAKRVQLIDKAEKAQKLKERMALQKALMPKLETVAGAIMTRLPMDSAEIVREGETLKTCVADYVERVAKGECVIVFVRQVEQPDVPFVTVEVRGDKVVQARGAHNAAPPKEVERFIRDWTKTWQQGKAQMMKGAM